MSAEDQNRYWVYDPSAGIPIWVVRRWHKIGSEEKLETTSGLVAYPGDTIREIGGVPALQPKLPDNFRFTEIKDGHVWGFWKQDTFQTCGRCMMIRRRDDKNSSCRGKAKLRSIEMGKGLPV